MSLKEDSEIVALLDVSRWLLDRGKARCDLEVLCLAHKKAQANTETFKVVKPLASKIIRLQLSLQGPIKKHLMEAARTPVKEPLVIVRGGPLSLEAQEHRERVLSLFLNRGNAYNNYRYYVISDLFDGDWRKTSRYEVLD